MKPAASLIRLYEEGLLTHGELVSKLIELASSITPESYVPDLSTELVNAIRDNQYVRNPPSSATELFSVAGVLYKPGTDIAAVTKREQEQGFAAALALHRYFREGKNGSNAADA